MRANRLPRTLAVALCAALVVLLSAHEASAGRVHPELDKQLQVLPPGATLPVIVEMLAQADPAAAAATVPRGQRLQRLQAVVDTLQDVAAQHQGGVRAMLAREQALGTATRVTPFWVFNGLAVTATEPVIRRLAARFDVFEVRPDSVIPPPPDIQPTAATGTSGAASVWNLNKVRAPEVWALNSDYTGVGQVVGSFDTGVDITHPDLAPRYRGNHAISWFDPYGEHGSPYDFNGHGTHTTGTMVGGSASGVNIGVAPGARWIAAKAWNDSGLGFASAFYAIFEWFLAPGGNTANAPDVVNASWGFSLAGCFGDFDAPIQALRAAGIFPSFSAGNSGPDSASVRSPGAGPDAFAAGATDAVDEIASFSSRGPSPCGGATKPDLSAPGVDVVSAYPGGYAVASGTSMAAPHVSGAVAILRAINPAVTVDELETVLMAGAVDLGATGADDTFGAGRLDLFQSAQILISGANIVSISPPNSTAMEAGQTSATLTVSRLGSTAAPLTVNYVVAGTATPGSDYVALPPSVTIPAGARSATLVVTALDDGLPEARETVTVTLVADPAYVLGTARTATVTIISDDPTADLVVSTLTAPLVTTPSSALTVADTVANQGSLGADASTLKFYLSTDTVFHASDPALGTRAVPALAIGQSSAGSTTIVIPGTLAAGPYYLIARADANDEIIEGDEDNNTRSVQIQVRVPVTVTPNSIDLAAPPVNFTMTGSGFADRGFGPPVANFVRSGVIIAQARAIAMTPTTLTVPYPTNETALVPREGLSAGAVDVEVYLQTAFSTFVQLGSGSLTVIDTRPPPSIQAIAPNPVDLAAPPVSFTVTGTALRNVGYGLPVVNFMRSGVMLAQSTATALTGTTTLTVPFPTNSLPGLSAGTVQADVYLPTASPAYTLIGSVTLTVNDTRPAPRVDAITPNPVDLAAVPASFSITGFRFANFGYGLPLVTFMRNGIMLAQSRATAMTLTTLTVPYPSTATPGLSVGSVDVQVYLQTTGTTTSLMGTVPLTVVDSRPAPRIDSITPNAIDLVAPPISFTVSGQGFANLGFGLPVANFMRAGVIIAQARATDLTPTTLTVPFPTNATALQGRPGLSAGPVDVQVYLQTSPATFSLMGSTPLTVTDTRPAPSIQAIAPNPVDLAAPPANFTVTGTALGNAGYGLPVVNFTRNGVMLAQSRATVLTGTTTLTVPFPASGLSAGTVQAEVYAQTGTSTFTFIGAVALTINDTRPPAGVTGITPNSIDLVAPPASFTISGSGFVNFGFGLPVVNFVRAGVIIAQARATALTPTALTVPFPTNATALASRPGLSAGPVDVQVYLQTSGSAFSLLGSTPLTVTDTRPAPSVQAITPNPVDLAAPPANFTVTGTAFGNLGYGLPVVNFTRSGVILAQSRATALAGTTTLTVPFPGAAVPGLSAGTVQAEVYSQTGTSSYALIGAVALTVNDTRPAPRIDGITPNAVDLAAPPASFSFTGFRFANLGFGAPVVNFMRNGTMLAQSRATALTLTTLTVPFPATGLSVGPVDAQVYLQTSASTYSLMGTAPFTVSDTRPAPSVDSITPNPIDLAAPPASFIITGQRFANLGFGSPVANFVRNGVIIAQARATAVTPTTLTVPFPTNATALQPRAGLSAGPVDVQVYLQTSASSFSLMGSTPLTVNDTRPASLQASVPDPLAVAAIAATSLGAPTRRLVDRFAVPGRSRGVVRTKKRRR